MSKASTPACPSVVRKRTGRLPFSRQFGAGRQDIGMWTPPATRPRASRSIEKRSGTVPDQGRASPLSDALTAAETTGLPYSVDESNPKAKHAPKPENRRRKFDRHSIAAIRLLTLTGARLREILDAEWEHVDLERGMIFLPDSKTGRKPIYLSAAAAAILSALPRIDGNPYVIPGEKTGQPRADLKRPWDAICEVAGLDGVRLHDLRHSFASVGGGISGTPDHREATRPSQPSTTQRYAHLDADPIRRAVETIGSTIAAAMAGKRQ